ncbi:MAG: terminase large subunit domain-containing protein [Thermoplasmatota archaeon]
MAVMVDHLLELRNGMERLKNLAYSKLAEYFPDTGPFRRSLYKKHLEFFEAGRTFAQRLFMAANRVGKTESGAYEVTCHTTGKYPPWWKGRRFDEPGEWWVCGTDSGTTRDTVQKALLGPVSPEGRIVGGGMLPLGDIIHSTRRPSALPGAIDTVWIRHVNGGHAVINFKSYEQGRKSFEGTSKQGIWCDEEPPEDCYTEMLYRTATTNGVVMVTFTPLQGMSAVVMGFVQPDTDEAFKYKKMINAGWDDVPHLDPATKAMLIATTPPFQRDARTKGLPQLGSGAVYGFPESELIIPDHALGPHLAHCFGMDAGGGAKPTAAVWLADERTAGGRVTLYAEYKRESPEVAIHLAAMKAKGDWIPGVGDAAALIVTEHDAEQLVKVYQRGGLDLVLADKAVETGVQAVWELISAGRFKVFASCTGWLREFRMYQRDEKGRIKKVNDHLQDSTRYAVNSGLKRAKVRPIVKSGRRHHGGYGQAGPASWMSG